MSKEVHEGIEEKALSWACPQNISFPHSIFLMKSYTASPRTLYTNWDSVCQQYSWKGNQVEHSNWWCIQPPGHNKDTSIQVLLSSWTDGPRHEKPLTVLTCTTQRLDTPETLTAQVGIYLPTLWNYWPQFCNGLDLLGSWEVISKFYS